MHRRKPNFHSIPFSSRRTSVTPNAQESEDSGVSLSYSLVSNDVARRIQHPAKEEKERDDVISERDNYDDQINAYRANTNKVKSLKDDFRCVLEAIRIGIRNSPFNCFPYLQ